MVVRPQERKNIIISGIFVGLTSLLAMGFIMMLGKEDSIFSAKFYLKTRVSNAQNLKEGAAVQLKGIKIGAIKSIQFEKLDSLVITFSVAEIYSPYIKTDSILSIRTQGVLGDKYLEILGGSETGGHVQNNDFVITEETNGLDKILSKGEDLMVVTSRVLGKLDMLMGGIEKDSLASIFNDLKSTAKQSRQLITDFNTNNIADALKNFSASSKNLEKSSKSFSSISKQIEQGPGTIHSMIYERALYDDLASLLDGSKRNKVLKYFIRETIRKSEKPVRE